MLNLAKCCCQKPNNLSATLIYQYHIDLAISMSSHCQYCVQKTKTLATTLISQYQCWNWPNSVVKILKLCQQHWFAFINVTSGQVLLSIAWNLANNIDLRISMLNLGKCCCQKPQTLSTKLIWQYQCCIWPSVVVKSLKLFQQHWFANINVKSCQA